MNVSIPDKLKGWAEQRVAEGRYSSTSDYIRDLVRRDQENEERVRRLQAAIDEGRASGVSERDPFEYLAELGGSAGRANGPEGLLDSLRRLWIQGVESGVAVDGNFDAFDIAERGAARLAAARRV
ncbi:MAG TPA: type II toxin-antitoxin system ParD family antitoxin [Allosphingosinicella sp.]